MLYYCRVFPVAQYTCMLSLYPQSGPERHGTIKCVPNPDPGPALSTRSRIPRKGKRHPRDRDRERRGPCSTQCDLLVKEWDYSYPTRRRESRWLSYLAAQKDWRGKGVKSDQELRERTKLVIDEFLPMFGFQRTRLDKLRHLGIQHASPSDVVQLR